MINRMSHRHLTSSFLQPPKWRSQMQPCPLVQRRSRNILCSIYQLQRIRAEECDVMTIYIYIYIYMHIIKLTEVKPNQAPRHKVALGDRGTAPRIHILGTRWRWWFSFAHPSPSPARFMPREGASYTHWIGTWMVSSAGLDAVAKGWRGDPFLPLPTTEPQSSSTQPNQNTELSLLLYHILYINIRLSSFLSTFPYFSTSKLFLFFSPFLLPFTLFSLSISLHFCSFSLFVFSIYFLSPFFVLYPSFTLFLYVNFFLIHISPSIRLTLSFSWGCVLLREACFICLWSRAATLSPSSFAAQTNELRNRSIKTHKGFGSRVACILNLGARWR